MKRKNNKTLSGVHKRKSLLGFTIVELVIVIAVIAILAAVLVPTFSNIITDAQDSRDKQDVLNIYKEKVSDLKATNILEDTNKNNKEEVLVVLRENKDDPRYFLFIDGKMEEKAEEPEGTEYDLKISNGEITLGNKVNIFTLTKVTDEQTLDGKTVVLISERYGNYYIAGNKKEESLGLEAHPINVDEDIMTTSTDFLRLKFKKHNNGTSNNETDDYWSISYIENQIEKYISYEDGETLYISSSSDESKWEITFIEEEIIISNKNYAYLGYNVVKEMFMLTLITNNYETPYVYIIED